MENESRTPYPSAPILYRVGFGYDVHRLVDGRKLILGGVEIPYEKGLEGHSDADVLVHALIDAILGAAGMGDIGTHFPSSDPTFKGISSLSMLSYAVGLAGHEYWRVGNVDATIVAQQPRLSPYTQDMKSAIAGYTGIHPEQVNVKSKTTDGLGFTGAGEGIAAYCVVMLARGPAAISIAKLDDLLKQDPDPRPPIPDP